MCIHPSCPLVKLVSLMMSQHIFIMTDRIWERGSFHCRTDCRFLRDAVGMAIVVLAEDRVTNRVGRMRLPGQGYPTTSFS